MIQSLLAQTNRLKTLNGMKSRRKREKEIITNRYVHTKNFVLITS